MKLDDAKLQRIQLELKVLDLRLQVAEAEVARFDVRRAWADAEFHEEDHPRAADGKFATVVGPSAVAGVEDYQKSLGGKKGNVAGLIRHLLMRGDVPEDQIFNAAVEHYGLGADKTHYVKWYHAELRKKGLAPPPLLQGEKLKKGPKIEKIEGPPPPPAHMPPPPPTSAPPPAPPSVDQLTKMTNREFFTTYGVGVFNKLDPGQLGSLASYSPATDNVIGVVRYAVACLPKAHLEALKNRLNVKVVDVVEIKGQSTTGLIGIGTAAGVFRPYSSGLKPWFVSKAALGEIEVGARWNVRGELRNGRKFASTANHEIGHALSKALGDISSDPVFIASIPELNARGTFEERTRSKYWHINTSETFAECYAAAFTSTTDGETFFGGMSRGRAHEVYGKTIETIELMIDARIKEREIALKKAPKKNR